MRRGAGGASLTTFGRAFLGLGPVLVVAAFLLIQGAVLASAGNTLGYDFEAYRNAALRILAGQPLYDSAAAIVGPFGLFLYPPPFAVAMIPFTWLPLEAARWAWLVAMALAFLVGTLILPVRPGVRWAVIGLGAICLPLLYAVKLGQVGPLLYLLFGLTWRFADTPLVTGTAITAGMLTKLQPGLLFGWLFFRREVRAIVVGVLAAASIALASTLITGVGVWHDYLALLGRVSSPITTPKNMTFGAIAWRAGLDAGVASTLQTATVVLACLLALVAWWRAAPASGLLVGVVVSQLVSPVLHDHYAMLTLLPVALLLQRRQWWAAVLPVLPWLGVDLLYPGILAISGLALMLPSGREEDVPLIGAWPGTAGL